MTIFAGKRLKVRCPRCKGKSFELSETCEESILFTVENGVMPKEATDHVPGAITGVSATCAACNHSWTPRGAKSIDDLVIEDDTAECSGDQGESNG